MAGEETTKPTGKVQQGSGKDAVNSLAATKVDAGDKTNRVKVNPELRGDVEVPYFDGDELKSETFAAGKTHLVDDKTAELKTATGVALFVSADDDK